MIFSVAPVTDTLGLSIRWPGHFYILKQLRYSLSAASPARPLTRFLGGEQRIKRFFPYLLVFYRPNSGAFSVFITTSQA